MMSGTVECHFAIKLTAAIHELMNHRRLELASLTWAGGQDIDIANHE